MTVSQAAQKDTHTQTQDALLHAIETGAFPARVMASAEALLTRLQTTTRVTLLGHPGTGKSAIVNLLAGENLIPDGIRLCSVQLIWGAREKVTVTLRDGSTLTSDGAPNWTHLAEQSPVFIKLEAPLAALKKISLLEVVTSGKSEEQARACKWAAKQTDIALWCTNSFDEDEQSQWHVMPDRIKDHAVLLRANAETLGDHRAQAIDALRSRAADGFAHVIAVSTLEADAARAAAGGVDKMRLRASGAVTLISTILRQIENGRQSAIDHAEMLLHIYRDFTPAISTVKARKFRFTPDTAANDAEVDETLSAAIDGQINVADEPEPTPATASIHPEKETEPTIGQASYSFSVTTRRGQQYRRKEPAQIPALQPRSTQHPKELVPSEVTELPDFIDAFDFGQVLTEPTRAEAPPVSTEKAESAKQVYRRLITQIQAIGSDLVEMDDLSPATVITRCFDEVSAALTQVTLLPPDGTHTQSTLAFQLQEAQDLIQLLSLENDKRGSEDAVSTLLQLKRAFQTAAG